MKMTRQMCVILVARQIALHDGLVWEKIPDKRRTQFMTLARNVLATVERAQGKQLLT